MTDADAQRLSERVYEAIHELTGACALFVVLVLPEGGEYPMRVIGNAEDAGAREILAAAQRKLTAQTAALTTPRGREATH